MKHRHLVDDCFSNRAAVADILERGTVNDWKVLYQKIQKNPKGEEAATVKIVLDNTDLYGTRIIWTRLLKRLASSDSV